MSGDVTRPLPGSYPTYRTARQRRRRRWPIAVPAVVAVILLLLFGADRAAAAYAASRAAQQLQSSGFPGTPQVTFEGFPFLTQAAARDFQHVHITASGIHEGPITASLVADALGVRMSPGYRSGVVTDGTGTVLVSFASIADAARAAGAPGVTVSANGPDQVKLKVDLSVFTATAIASITQAGPQTFRVHLISAGGLPASLLGPLGDFTFSVPKLPYGLTIQRVRVTSAGVAGYLSAHNIRFGQ